MVESNKDTPNEEAQTGQLSEEELHNIFEDAERIEVATAHLALFESAKAHDPSLPESARRRAAFNLAEILEPSPIIEDGHKRFSGRVARWEANGQKYNPNGAKLPVTIARVNSMMRRRRRP